MTAPWQPLLDWWFGPPATALEVASVRQGLWFGKRAEQDREARERFGALLEQALKGGLEDWAHSPPGWLALILLLDQLPRMVLRDSGRAYAGDLRAQALVERGLAQGWDRQVPAIARVFVYLVFEHAEDLALQVRAVQLFRDLRAEAPAAEQSLFDGYLDYAERHRQVIARFGRFPHRNALLDRRSTAEELGFLQEPGSGF
ncbi:MAG: DUF924 family protein [Pseudomonas sp.]|uniref:DUF924 family protein n=1 Tax=Pseudomonas sp. TaxID=306 RepID=UPI0033977710